MGILQYRDERCRIVTVTTTHSGFLEKTLPASPPMKRLHKDTPPYYQTEGRRQRW